MTELPAGQCAAERLDTRKGYLVLNTRTHCDDDRLRRRQKPRRCASALLALLLLLSVWQPAFAADGDTEGAAGVTTEQGAAGETLPGTTDETSTDDLNGADGDGAAADAPAPGNEEQAAGQDSGEAENTGDESGTESVTDEEETQPAPAEQTLVDLALLEKAGYLTVTGISKRTCTGKAVTLSPVVKVAGRTLKNGTDYTLSYKNNVRAGTATVTITAKGSNYTGQVSRNFALVSRTAKTLTWSGVKLSLKTAVQIDGALPAAAGPTRAWVTGRASSMQLYWKKAKDVSAIDGYLILRRAGNATTYTEVARVGKNKTTYVDKSASKKNCAYTYTIVGYKKAGNTLRISPCVHWVSGVTTKSARPNGYTATLNKKQVTLSSGDTVRLTLKYATAVHWSGKTRWYSDNSKVATVSANGTVSAKDPGTTTIRGRLPSGREVTCKVTVKKRATPKAPAVSIMAATDSRLILRWPAVANATHYDVYRATGTGKFQKLGTTKEAAYDSTGLNVGTTYRYYVVARNAKGDYVATSSPSKTVSRTMKKGATLKAATTVTGVPSAVNRTTDQAVAFTVKVTPAIGGRTVYLQRYNSAKKTWQTMKTYWAGDTYSASVAIGIDRKYRSRTTGLWRVQVAESGLEKAYTGKTFRVTSPNIAGCNISARSACIYCVDTGQFIYRKNSQTRRAQASTTKLMTAVMLMESGKINQSTTISSTAARTGWGCLYMTPGDRYRNIDLLYAMMLPSSNDAAAAVAEGVGGSQANFVRMMNNKAQSLGMKNTHFTNPHGLDNASHYSTAEDVAILTGYAYRNPTLRTAWLTRSKTIRSQRYGRSHRLSATDALIGYSSAFKGGKTGTTGNAGCCFTGVYVYGGKTYVTVVLGSGYGSARWADTQALHAYIRNYGAQSY